MTGIFFLYNPFKAFKDKKEQGRVAIRIWKDDEAYEEDCPANEENIDKDDCMVLDPHCSALIAHVEHFSSGCSDL